MHTVRAFAGDDYEQAVVEDDAWRALSRWDDRMTHYNVPLRAGLSIVALVGCEERLSAPSRRSV